MKKGNEKSDTRLLEKRLGDLREPVLNVLNPLDPGESGPNRGPKYKRNELHGNQKVKDIAEATRETPTRDQSRLSKLSGARKKRHMKSPEKKKSPDV